MPHSMTGFARSEFKSDWGTVSCELKSVNHRYLDIYFRMPENLREFELQLRDQIKSQVSRGKFECTIQLQTQAGNETGTGSNQGFDMEVAEPIILAAEAIALKIQKPAAIDPLEILKMPGVTTHTTIDSENLKAAVGSALTRALERHAAMRLREGKEMARIVTQRIDAIGEQVEWVKKIVPDIREALKQRLLDKLDQLDLKTNPERLEQELVLQAQRMDIDEEIDRLETHINEVRRTLERDEPIGRRLDFLMQELNREANTLGSKSQAVESSNVSVELKVLIEQMREQIQNIE